MSFNLREHKFITPQKTERALVMFPDRKRDGIFWTAVDDGLGFNAMRCDFTREEADARFDERIAQLIRNGWETIR